MKIGRTLFLLYFLVLMQWAGAQTSAELRQFAEGSVYDVWYGIYAMDQKLGYYHIVAELSEDGKQYVVSEDMLVVSTFAGELSEDRSTLEIRYSLEDGLIDSSEAEESGGGERLLITVERQGDKLKLTSNSGGRPESRLIEMSKTTLNAEMKFVEWLKTAGPGETFDSFSLDWTKEPVDTPQTFTFKSKETAPLNGVVTELYNLQEESFELTEDGQFDSKGVPVWLKTGGLFEIKREPEEVATNLGETPVEILAKTTVKSDVKLGEPPLQELVLQASGLGEFKFPEATYQKVQYLSNGEARLTISPPQGKPEPSELQDREKYLKANPTLQSDSPEVKRLVESLGLRGLSERRKVEKLTRWVYYNLEKASNVNASTSLSVLKNRAGDCTEHTILLTTLLRAAGIPARELSGLVYTNDDLQVFGYHAWVEVYVDGGWLAVDPTFNQVPADAGHILQSREDSLAELQIMGTLRLTVEKLRSSTKKYERKSKVGLRLEELLIIALVGTVVVGASASPGFSDAP